MAKHLRYGYCFLTQVLKFMLMEIFVTTYAKLNF